jgi:hypothetical protein
MADGVRYILDKLAALFRRLEDTELFTKVGREIDTDVDIVGNFQHCCCCSRMRSSQLSRKSQTQSTFLSEGIWKLGTSKRT